MSWFPFAFWKRFRIPPNAPSSLTATTFSTTRIDLAWTDNSSNETTFRIERANVTDGIFSQIVSLAANTTTYSDTTVSNKEGYYYRVRAVGSTGNSAYSNTAWAMTWGLASDGDLTVDGVDFYWSPGSKYDYGQINIINGGRILPDTTNDGAQWIEVATTGVYIDGISGIDFSAIVTGTMPNFQAISPDRTVLTWTKPQGEGGVGGSITFGPVGGNPSSGNGGGGASLRMAGGDADANNSGVGADSSSLPGGASVGINGQSGINGTDDDESVSGSEAVASGASGGTRGRHGCCGYFRNSGAWVIDLGGYIYSNGEPGGAGANGGNATTNASDADRSWGGGAGGPGAGGNAGKFIVTYHSGSDPSPAFILNGGTAGMIGFGGGAAGGVTPAFDFPGGDSGGADDGYSGALTVTII